MNQPTIHEGERYSVFDIAAWERTTDNDFAKYYKPATVVEVYLNSDLAVVADVRFDHKPGISKGHFATLFRELPSANAKNLQAIENAEESVKS